MTASRDASLARSMAERHDLRPNTVEPILDLGSVNHVFVVRSERDAYVVRFARDPLRQNGFDLERWCLEQATAHHIPSPRVVASGVHLGVPYLIQSYVDGSPGTATRSLALWATLGRYGRIVHHIPLTQDAPDSLFSRFGRDLPSAWQAHLSYNLEALNPADPLVAWGVYAAGDQARLRSLVRELGQLPTSFGLNHGDLSLRNALVPDAGDPVLIDWGSAAAGPTPFGDLLSLLKMHRDR